MGYWSTGIMGGDSPLDIEFEIMENIDLEKVTLKSFRDFIYSFDNKNNRMFYERDVAHVVLGYKMLELGFDIEDELKTEIIRIALKEDFSEWGDSARERYEKVNKFVELLSDPSKATEEELEKIAR